ncbi:histidine utilization repressor [Propionivibrio sp.]|jgi:GntR family histidine utilization transcriptional repressor|uniref:histidine utilization repressor n=1 Tax=Propionivibrio sp. TaxID=2212460 RepID=UPI0039E32BF3
MSKRIVGDDAPAYRRIKAYVLDSINQGALKEGDLIPSEKALGERFKVSRMTVNRAMRELNDEQVVVRVQGSGTFVAPQKVQATVIELRNIADEIAARGHAHQSELQLLERVKAGEALARKFGLPAQATLFHSIVVHLENGQPIQLEDRYVNPAVAPDYMRQDFSRLTPNAYLTEVAPLQGVQFMIEACLPPKHVGELLHMAENEPCLLMRRVTRAHGQTATLVALWHPGSRYQLTGGY